MTEWLNYPGKPSEIRIDITGNPEEVRNPKPSHEVMLTLKETTRTLELVRSNISNAWLVLVDTGTGGKAHYFLGSFDDVDEAQEALKNWLKYH